MATAKRIIKIAGYKGILENHGDKNVASINKKEENFKFTLIF